MRFYPTRMCTVCNTYLHHRPRFERTINWIMLLCICVLFLVSSSHLLAKIGIGVSLLVLLGVFFLYNCLTRDLSLFVIAMCLLPGVAQSDMMMMLVSIGLIAIGTVYTFAYYIPVEYTFVFAATTIVGLYMGMFIASVSPVLDIYGTFLTTLTLFFFWYGWIKLHPPLRLLME